MVTEALLDEIEERAKLAAESIGDDQQVAMNYANHAANRDVPALVAALRSRQEYEGGGLGQMVRDALKDKILARAKACGLGEKVKELALSDQVRVHSINVAVIGGEPYTIVDIRLAIGDRGRDEKPVEG